MTSGTVRTLTSHIDVRGQLFSVSTSETEIGATVLPGLPVDPAVAGYVGFGDTLSVAGSWDSYQWYRDGVAISGAVGATYEIQERDLDAMITVGLGFYGDTAFAEPVGPVVPLDVDKVDAAGDLVAYYNIQDLSTMWQDLARTVPAAVGSEVLYIDEATGKTARDLSISAGSGPTLRHDATLDRYYLETPQGAGAKAIRSAANLTLSEATCIVAAISHSGLGSSSVCSIGTVATNSFGFRNTSSAYRFTTRVQPTGQSAVSGNGTGAAHPEGSAALDHPVAVEIAISETELQSAAMGSAWGVNSYTGGTGFSTFANCRIGIFTESGSPGGTDGRELWGMMVINGDKDHIYQPHAAMLAKHWGGILAAEYPDEIDIFLTPCASNGMGRGDQATSTPPAFGDGWYYFDATDGVSDGSIAYPKDPCNSRLVSFSSVANTGSLLPAFARTYYASSGRPVCFVHGGESGAGYCVGSFSTAGSDWSTAGDLTDDIAGKGARCIKYWEDRGVTIRRIWVIPLSGLEADENAGKTTSEIVDALTDGVDGFVVRLRTALAAAMTTKGCSAAAIALAEEAPFGWFKMQPNATNDYDQANAAIDQVVAAGADQFEVCGDLGLYATYGAAAFIGDGEHLSQTSLTDMGEDAGPNSVAAVTAFEA